MVSSTARAPARKPFWSVAGHRIKRPHPTFPLTPATSGAWMKRINGKLVYFGRWATRTAGNLVPLPEYNWQAAEAEYNRTAADLAAGRTPSSPDTITVGVLCSLFLEDALKRLGFTADEITPLATCPTKGWRRVWWPALRGRSGDRMSPRQALEYRLTADRLVATFGKTKLVSDLRAADFTTLRHALAKQFGPVRLGNEIMKARRVFNWAAKNEIVNRPPCFGEAFTKPSKATLLKHRADRGPPCFTADECRRLIDAADPVMRAMIYLGLNAAFGNTDVGDLPLSALDLTNGWATFRRGKTGVGRRAKLWPETVSALRAAVAVRPVPAEAAFGDRVFLTRFGNPFAADGHSSIPAQFAKLLKAVGVNGRRGFYAFRHTFRTVADGAGDVTAVRTVMGHSDGTIDSTYRHGIDDARLVAVADFVRAWLVGGEGGAA